MNNIVDNIEQCCPKNIVAYCFQKLLIFGCVRSLRATNMASLYGVKVRRCISRRYFIVNFYICFSAKKFIFLTLHTLQMKFPVCYCNGMLQSSTKPLTNSAAIITNSAPSSLTIESSYANFKLLSLFVSYKWTLFTVNEYKNICIAGLKSSGWLLYCKLLHLFLGMCKGIRFLSSLLILTVL